MVGYTFILFLLLDIGDISSFSYFGGNGPISETGDIYSGTFYQKNEEPETVQEVYPSKVEAPKKEQSVLDEQPIFYYQGEYEDVEDLTPTKVNYKEEQYEEVPLEAEVFIVP